MARSSPINSLYEHYKADPQAGLEELLKAVRVRALHALQSEDVCQEFLIRLLPTLQELPEGGNFAGWLNVRLRWAKLHAYRDELRCKELPVSYVELGLDDDGVQMSNGEKLDLLAYRDGSQFREELPLDLTEIADPVFRQVARLLLMGYAQDEAARQLGISVGSIKQRLFRTRQKKLALAA